MRKNRLTISEAAAADIVDQAEWYQEQSGAGLARRWERRSPLRFCASWTILKRARSAVFKHSELSNVRRILISGFPKHLIFYQVRKSEIIILRIVHGARDLESLF